MSQQFSQHLHLFILSPSDGKLRCTVCPFVTDIPEEEAKKIAAFESLLRQGKRGGLTVTETAAEQPANAAAAAPAEQKKRGPKEPVLPEGAIGLKDAAELLNTDPKSLRRRLRKEGYTKPGSRWYLTQEQLDKLAAGAKEKKETAAERAAPAAPPTASPA